MMMVLIFSQNGHHLELMPENTHFHCTSLVYLAIEAKRIHQFAIDKRLLITNLMI